MDKIIQNNEIFSYKEYQLEDEFERTVVKNYRHIFGINTVYIDIKKKIGSEIVTIPDGYLIDFTFSQKPRLYIIENELAIHDAYKHIGSQLLKFAISYKDSGRNIKKFILGYLSVNKEMFAYVEKRAADAHFRNIDDLLEKLIYDFPVSAIVVIDKSSKELENVLGQLTLNTDIIEFQTYCNASGKELHKYTPFNDELQDREVYAPSSTTSLDQLDTIVVPAQEQGFQEAFIEQNAWWAIRISAAMLDRIKYIATYQVAPISAITYVGEVSRIEKFKDTNKYIIYLKDKATAINPQIKLDGKKKGLAPQAPRYANYQKLMTAKTLADVF